MATVRQDKHSLYIKQGGYLFRPVYPVGYQASLANQPHANLIKAGDKLKARHIGGTPLAEIKLDNGELITWYSHGDYLTTGAKSVDLWKPKYEHWG